MNAATSLLLVALSCFLGMSSGLPIHKVPMDGNVIDIKIFARPMHEINPFWRMILESKMRGFSKDVKIINLGENIPPADVLKPTLNQGKPDVKIIQLSPIHALKPTLNHGPPKPEVLPSVKNIQFNFPEKYGGLPIPGGLPIVGGLPGMPPPFYNMDILDGLPLTDILFNHPEKLNHGAFIPPVKLRQISNPKDINFEEINPKDIKFEEILRQIPNPKKILPQLSVPQIDQLNKLDTNGLLREFLEAVNEARKYYLS